MFAEEGYILRKLYAQYISQFRTFHNLYLAVVDHHPISNTVTFSGKHEYSK